MGRVQDVHEIYTNHDDDNISIFYFLDDNSGSAANSNSPTQETGECLLVTVIFISRRELY